MARAIAAMPGAPPQGGKSGVKNIGFQPIPLVFATGSDEGTAPGFVGGAIEAAIQPFGDAAGLGDQQAAGRMIPWQGAIVDGVMDVAIGDGEVFLAGAAQDQHTGRLVGAIMPCSPDTEFR